MTDANKSRTLAQVNAELSQAMAKLPAMRTRLAESIVALRNGAPDALKQSRALQKESAALTREVNRLAREAAGLSRKR